ncbi:MAG: histidine ammonia-lyase [Bacteroidetes bacterium]|nr:histidine ammonia-lyase [Bacteroidota bacterium]
MILTIGEKPLTLADLEKSVKSTLKLQFSASAKKRIQKSRQLVEHIETRDEPFYGINTGFGKLCQVQIPANQLEKLQENLILSHAVGVGESIPNEIVRLMILIKVNSLAQGFSGIRQETMDMLIRFYNEGVTPVIPSQGSVGASGDLAPLAHMVLPIMGFGQVEVDGKRIPSAEVFTKWGIEPLKLQSKEGLALINGTQLMSGYLAYCLMESIYLAKLADVVAAMSLDAYQGSLRPFDARVHDVRPHKGQIDVAANIRKLMTDSEILKSHENCPKVQDPYSLRCVPQVHGASRNAFRHAQEILETEINSATDNPLIFDEETVISGGNFHGQPLALPLDYMAIALAELASISERRQYLLLEGPDGLPRLLMKDTGINSGFMIPQYTSASLVSENKVLAHPASVDSIPTSLGQEDHVSMGSVGALKLYRILQNVRNVLSIELLCAAQALDFRAPKKPGNGVNAAYRKVREHIRHADYDRLFSEDIKACSDLVHDRAVLQAVEKAVGKLE